MSANITAGAATSSADLLTDLKSGYLLGANPRKQFIAQFAGIFIGTVVTVLAFSVLVPNAQVLGTDQFPAPAAQTWSAVAFALAQGLSALEPIKLWLIFAGSVVGVVLTLAPIFLPKHQAYLPSASAFGLAWVFHWYYGLLFFLGALLRILRRAPRTEARRRVHPAGRFGCGGRRLADGGGAGALGERRQHSRQALRRLTRPVVGCARIVATSIGADPRSIAWAT